MLKSKNAYKTDYKDLFYDTCWGMRSFIDTEFNWDVINNRNDFVKKYDIKKVLNEGYYSGMIEKKALDFRILDHMEVYETIYKWVIIIVSPYKNSIDNTDNLLGFNKYDTSLFSDETDTYIQIFRRRKLFNDFARSIEKL